jgi:predicted aspartyl protease
MGLTYIQASIANPARPRRSARLKFLVDSGALYSVVPTPVLRRLGIKRGKSKSFILADGTEIKRSLGQALFRMNGDEAASPVIFGEKGDSTLLGSVSLEALGLMLDPFKRELRPLPMILASHRPDWKYGLGGEPDAEAQV